MQNRRGTKTAPTASENGASRHWAARAAARRMRDLFRPKGSELPSSISVTVESIGNDAQQRSKAQDKAGPQMVVKFELAVRPPTRRRANTDSDILKYSKSRQESWEPEAERLSSKAFGKTITVTGAESICTQGRWQHSEQKSRSGNDDKNENSQEQPCYINYQPAEPTGFDASFASTADGFEIHSGLLLQSSQPLSSSTQQSTAQQIDTSEKRFASGDTPSSKSGEDDESEDSEERCCEVFLGAHADSQVFLSILTADGFEDDKPESHIAHHQSAASESFLPSSSSVRDVLGADPQGGNFPQGGGIYCMGPLQHEKPRSWLSGSSNQHRCNDHSFGTLGSSSSSWCSPRPSHINMKEQTTLSKAREGRFAVELNKLLNQDLVQANMLDPHSGTASISNSKEFQRRSQELNVITAEIHAARLKAYALEAEAAARQAWFEAYATRQAEVVLSASSSSASTPQRSSALTTGRHSAPPTLPLMAQIAESSAENPTEPTYNKDLEAKSGFAHSGHVRSSSDRSESSWCSGERKFLPQDPDSTNTTVMMRHMPPSYTREKLLSLLDSEGFRGSFDFVYLPVDFTTFQGFGYAFINCTSNREAHSFFKHFQGFTAWPPSHMTAEEATGPPSACEVSWGDPLQGRAAHIDRYRNSPVMHKDVPEQFKPVTFDNGVRVKFPTPTKRIRPPRLKHGHPSDSTKSGRMTLAEQLEIRQTLSPGDAAGG